MRKTFQSGALGLRRLGRTFLRELVFVYRFAPKYSAAMTFVQFMVGALPAIELFIAAKIVDGILHAAGSGWTSQLTMLVALELALMGFHRLMFIFNDYISNYLQGYLRVEVNDRIHRMVLTFDLPTLEQTKVHTLISYLKENSWRPHQMVYTVFTTLGNAVASISFIGIAFSFSPLMTVLFVIAVIPSVVISVRAIAKAEKVAWGKAVLMNEVWYYESFFKNKNTLVELMVHNITKLFADRFKNTFGKVIDKELVILRHKLWSSIIANIVAFAVYIFAYLEIIFAAITEKISIGQFTLYIGAYVNLERFMVSQVWQLATILEHTKFLDSFHDLEAIRPNIVERKNAVDLVGPIRVEFQNVSFKYPGEERTTMEDVSFTIEEGECVALVGENGAGKSTLVKLLLRLYEPTEGMILINDRDYRDYTIASLRRELGVTFQDFIRFSLTARENVALGDVAFMDAMEEIEQAARESGIHERIERLPKKYEMPLGHAIHQDGVDLSGGEWQKIALARSLVKNASLLILDEPTAALDARSEYEFFEKLFNSSKKRSLLLISHRFSSVRFADKILVLEHGKLIEVGKHLELMSQNGLYAELYDLQTKEIS